MKSFPRKIIRLSALMMVLNFTSFLGVCQQETSVFISYQLSLTPTPESEMVLLEKSHEAVNYQSLMSERPYFNDLFLNKIKGHDSVMNYVWILGFVLPEVDFNRGFLPKSSDSLCCNGEFYIDKTKGEQLSFKHGRIERKGEVLFDENLVRVRQDTVHIEYIVGPSTTSVFERKWSFDTILQGLQFVEKWSLDDESKSFKKDIELSGCYEYGRNALGNEYNWPLFQFEMKEEQRAQLSLLKQNVTYDVFFKYRDYYNNPNSIESEYNMLNYLNPLRRKLLLEQIFLGIDDGRYKLAPYTDDISLIKASDQLNFDTLYHNSQNIEYSESIDGKVYITMVPYYKNDIEGLRFLEDWYVDTETFQLVKKVKAVTFLTSRSVLNSDRNGQINVMLPYWILFDEE